MSRQRIRYNIPVGSRYGRRVTLSLPYRTKGRTVVDMLCDCGVIGQANAYDILKGKNKSCGCARKDTLNRMRGENHPSWRGGRYKWADGYISVHAPDHPYAVNKRVREHRLVMEQVLGRYLLPSENVHHKNGVKDDNCPENLELWSTSQPKGQRVEDKTKWAIEWLKTYRPELITLTQ